MPSLVLCIKDKFLSAVSPAYRARKVELRDLSKKAADDVCARLAAYRDESAAPAAKRFIEILIERLDLRFSKQEIADEVCAFSDEVAEWDLTMRTDCREGLKRLDSDLLPDEDYDRLISHYLDGCASALTERAAVEAATRCAIVRGWLPAVVRGWLPANWRSMSQEEIDALIAKRQEETATVEGFSP